MTNRSIQEITINALIAENAKLRGLLDCSRRTHLANKDMVHLQELPTETMREIDHALSGEFLKEQKEAFAIIAKQKYDGQQRKRLMAYNKGMYEASVKHIMSLQAARDQLNNRKYNLPAIMKSSISVVADTLEYAIGTIKRTTPMLTANYKKQGIGTKFITDEQIIYALWTHDPANKYEKPINSSVDLLHYITGQPPKVCRSALKRCYRRKFINHEYGLGRHVVTDYAVRSAFPDLLARIEEDNAAKTTDTQRSQAG